MTSAKGVLASDRVGREIPAQYQAVVKAQVEQLGWRYDSGSGRSGHPRLFPKDTSKPPLAIPGSPSDPRSYKNFVSLVRRNGGKWPRR